MNIITTGMKYGKSIFCIKEKNFLWIALESTFGLLLMIDQKPSTVFWVGDSVLYNVTEDTEDCELELNHSRYERSRNADQTPHRLCTEAPAEEE
jgi:hypothetical protein